MLVALLWLSWFTPFCVLSLVTGFDTAEDAALTIITAIACQTIAVAAVIVRGR